MKHLLRISLTVLIVICLVYGCTSPFVTTSISPAPGTATGNAIAPTAEVVLPTRTCGDYFIVDAMINDTGPYAMLLDTGAGTTVIAPEAAKAAGVFKRIKSITIDRFSAAGRIPCKVQDIDHLSRALGTEISGILAYGVFKGVLLTYDYPAQEIRVRKGAFDESELTHPGVVPTSKGKTPYVNASVGDVKFTVLLDTGSSRSLTLKKLGRFSFEAPPTPTGARMRLNGLFIVESGRVATDMTLGPLRLSRPIIHNSVSNNLAGQEVLRDFIITFDQVNHRVRFARPDGSAVDAPIEFPSMHGTGFAAAPRDDRLIVRRVFEGTPAQSAGLLVDDDILAIDGTPIAERGCEHLEYKPPSGGGGGGGSESVELQIVRAGEPLTITIETDVLVR